MAAIRKTLDTPLDSEPSTARARSMKVRRSTITPRAVVPLVAALLALSPIGANASAPASDPATAAYEVDFMKSMVDHHGMALEMAEPCLERATHPALKSMCEEVVSAQSREIDRMQRWLGRWYERQHEPRMTKAERADMERLEDATGRRFEVRFMRMLIRHHEMAVEMARECLDRAEHPELRGLCSDIVEVQRKEISALERWLCAWYDKRCKKD